MGFKYYIVDGTQNFYIHFYALVNLNCQIFGSICFIERFFHLVWFSNYSQQSSCFLGELESTGSVLPTFREILFVLKPIC